MALQGTIKDFGPGEIFQLIGIQRKSGVLVLENDEDTVTVKFAAGQVVGVDTKTRSVEELLGNVLVRTGRMTDEQLQRALRIQRKTLQRLGHILVKNDLISVEELIDALRIQSLQIIYRLFRWRTGRYHFRTEENVEYDEKHFFPISAETILMEGARMIDEWPLIERHVKSDQMVFRRLAGTHELQQSVDAIDRRDVAPPAAAVKRPAKSIELTPDQRQVLALVDGRRTVAEITQHSSLGEFDTCRILADFVSRKLVAEVRQGRAGSGGLLGRETVRRLVRWGLNGLVLVLVLGAALTLRTNPLAPWRVFDEQAAEQQLRRYASQNRISRIERALQVFYLDAGTYPSELELLSLNGYLLPEDLVDPWDSAYGYLLTAGGYELVGRDGTGQVDPDLTVFHRFGPMQRMMLQFEEGDGNPAPEQEQLQIPQ